MGNLYIKNGKTIEGIAINIIINDGVISEINPDIIPNDIPVLDLNGESYVSAGWIDGHVHCYEKMTLYYDHPDKVGIESGVTTIIDAGSTGANNVADFYECTEKAKTNVYALLNISENGIIAQDELADLTKIKPELIKEVLKKYPEFIVGLKARMSTSVVGENGIIPLEMAKAIQNDNGNPTLMVHIGSAPPELKDVLELLDKGDIVTHCFNGKSNGILDAEDQIKDFVWDAYNKDVVFDIGHGTASFNFHVAEVALKEKMIATTISTDIYHGNRENGPVFNLATTMEKLLGLGYSLEAVISKVTSEPAKHFNLENKGEISVGKDGDLTIFKLTQNEKILVDSQNNERTMMTQIVPEWAVVGGDEYRVKS